MMYLYTWCEGIYTLRKDGLFVSFCILWCLILCVRCLNKLLFIAVQGLVIIIFPFAQKFDIECAKCVTVTWQSTTFPYMEVQQCVPNPVRGFLR